MGGPDDRNETWVTRFCNEPQIRLEHSLIVLDATVSVPSGVCELPGKLCTGDDETNWVVTYGSQREIRGVLNQFAKAERTSDF